MFQVTGKQILPIYLKVVESSYFNSSDKVTGNSTLVFFLFFKFLQAENRNLLSCLIIYCNLGTWQVINLSDEVEEWFIKHFTGENRRKAMKYLKPHHRKESHSVTFFIGEFF